MSTRLIRMDLRKTGRLISKKRKALNLTQGQLSEKLGVTPQAVHLWESGQRYPDVSSQIMIHKVLGLNPVELISGLEMFDEDLKKDISSHMGRIDENVFVAGNMKDLDGNDIYVDLSDYLVPTVDKDGNISDKLIPYTDYFNVEPPKEEHESSNTSKTPYDPEKIYLNHGHCILVFSVELLDAMGRAPFFRIHHNRNKGKLLISFEDNKNEGSFDIPEKVYSGNWKGIHVHGGEFGHALCVEMGIRCYYDLLEIIPQVDIKNKRLLISLDEVKRSTADITYSDFLLPQWQYDELVDDE